MLPVTFYHAIRQQVYEVNACHFHPLDFVATGTAQRD